MNLMTIIDHRILIPTSPDAVWEIISDINSNPHWQVDCQAISFLTSLRAGPRVRWRCTSPSGDESVIETTAWYDGLGYEYTYIDGAPFRTSKGTLRLQEIPEGTVVQWTLNYEVGGLVGGVRNALSVRRSFNNRIVESLKALYAYVKETGKTRQSHEARSLMRDALDYEARAQYVPRHPSRYIERASEDEDQADIRLVPSAEPAIVEPPVSDEDTRPNPVLTTDSEPTGAPASATQEASQVRPQEEPAAETEESAAPPPAPAEAESDEWAAGTAQGPLDLARFQRPPYLEPAPSAIPSPITEEPAPTEAPPEPAPDTPQPEPPATTEAPATETAADIVDKPETPAAEPPSAEPAAEAAAPEPAADESDTPFPALAPKREPGPGIDTSQMDTREISIWEVFGVPPPSETDRIKAITDEQLQEADAASTTPPPAAETPAPASTPPPAAETPVPTAPAPAPSPVPQAALSAQTRPAPALLMIGFRVYTRRARVRLRRRH